MSGHGNQYFLGTMLILAAMLSAGCGTTRSRMATEQLLMSDAVDRSVAQIDFAPLAGKRVFFDTQYLNTIKGLGFVNSDYIISSVRQQMLAAGCMLSEKQEDAEDIVEGRCGALGTDGHEVTYGVPASPGLSNFASMLPNAPTLPLLPEIAIAKKEDNRAAAKIGLFAYHRETRMPVWQSGVSVSSSDAKDTWVFGAGPFQNGDIYDGAQFAGSRLRLPLLHDDDDGELSRPPMVSYFHEMDFERQRRVAERRRKVARESIERLAEIPELMPLSRSTLVDPPPPRRLPSALEGTEPDGSTAPKAETAPDATPAAQPATPTPPAAAPESAEPKAAEPAPAAGGDEDPAATVVR